MNKDVPWKDIVLIAAIIYFLSPQCGCDFRRLKVLSLFLTERNIMVAEALP